MDSPPFKPRFWIKFQVYSDGLDTQQAQDLATLSTFSQFPNLPPELRLKVWEYLLRPRIILASCLEGEVDSEQLSELAARPSRPFVPVLLHISHETRALALAHYELAFSWKVPHVLSSLDLGPGIGQQQYQPPTWSEPHVYFNFKQDAIFLMGELEPYDSYGFNSPMSYFLRKEDTQRVRHVAVAFRALRYGETGSQQIFGALFHVVDRFTHPVGGRVLVCVTEGDEMTNALMGGESPLENVAQQIWKDWYRGSIVTSSLAGMEFKTIWEVELERYIAEEAELPAPQAQQVVSELSNELN
ncbi:uncharacterized protein BCR38DRAFT_458106 [Pseudomassariella vexata]|uniref:2EXR domain-containing protein n=1 Tax=Pseudomassariella vexata TaxID=1141098 RepID=A0A1Y2DYS3_9PEZI|nr:uncharacterized protein BCR38DRAFT_458106 [Pseudomassariella vexata]ORY64421.1 hypothetical protein BCR38DRAFT_458106 [Pseudomassariella vexata]